MTYLRGDERSSRRQEEGGKKETRGVWLNGILARNTCSSCECVYMHVTLQGKERPVTEPVVCVLTGSLKYRACERECLVPRRSDDAKKGTTSLQLNLTSFVYFYAKLPI